MNRHNFKILTILVFTLTALGIGTLIFLPHLFFSGESEINQTRVVIPQNVGSGGNPSGLQENQNLEEGSAARVTFDEGVAVISIIARDFDQDSEEEQIIAYRNVQEIDTPIYLTYADETAPGSGYQRVWTAPTAATRASTLILYSEDLIGDGGICVLASGMNGAGEQTLTVFRKVLTGANAAEAETAEPFTKIAEFIIEGSIAVQEVRGTADYQAAAQSLTIFTFGRDF